MKTSHPKTQAHIKKALIGLFSWDVDEFTASCNGFEIRVVLDTTFEDGRDRACVRYADSAGLRLGWTLCAEGEDLDAASARLWGMLGKKVR